MAQGNLYSIDTIQLLANLPGVQLLFGVYFLTRGVLKAVEAARKLSTNGHVPFNRASNMGAAMFCALNVAVVLFIAVLWLSAVAELLSLAQTTQDLLNRLHAPPAPSGGL